MINDDESKREKRRKKIEDASYPVGFGRTPPATQFPKGKSGNPKGRPKNSLGIKAMVCKAFEAPVEYQHKGRVKKSTRIQMGLDRLGIDAAKGDFKAIQAATKLYAQHGPVAEAGNDEIDLAADEKALDDYLARRSKFAKN